MDHRKQAEIVAGLRKTADWLERTAPPAPVGWQDISTAPKDGTRILLWDGKSTYLAHWDAEFDMYSVLDEATEEYVHRAAWTDDGVKSFAYEETNEIESPTHWQALPAPPDQEHP